MPNRILSAGDYIAARCTKCKVNTNHTIVAMVGEKVVKVECNTCGSTHKYHGEKAPKSSSRPVTTGSKAKPRSTKSQRNWEEMSSNLRREDMVPYSMTTPMQEGMWIQHPSFGLGQVIGTSKPNKMEVRFADGVKLLRCTLS